MIPLNNTNSKTRLYYNQPLAKSIPKEVYSKNSQILIAWYKNCLQEAYVRGVLTNLNESLSITVDVAQIGRLKGLSPSALTNFKTRMFDEAKEFLMNNNPAIYIEVEENGIRKKKLINVFAGTEISETGELTIHSSSFFQQYYISTVLAHPELQIGLEFYLLAKSQYSAGLLELLTSVIVDRRNSDNQISASYNIILPFDIVREKVPPKSPSMIKSNYVKRVINQAIADINKNPSSPIKIDNFELVKKNKIITDLIFDVSFTDATRAVPPFPTFFLPGLVDPISKCPSMEYCLGRLDAMGVSPTIINQAKKKPTPLVAAALMYTLSKGGSPRLFNTAMNNWAAKKSIEEYANEVMIYHPELMDDVITSMINHDDFRGSTAIPKTSIEEIADEGLKEALSRAKKALTPNA